jgi:hypothetical protein
VRMGIGMISSFHCLLLLAFLTYKHDELGYLMR